MEGERGSKRKDIDIQRGTVDVPWNASDPRKEKKTASLALWWEEPKRNTETNLDGEVIGGWFLPSFLLGKQPSKNPRGTNASRGSCANGKL